MPFTPYHKFAYKDILENQIFALNGAGSIPQFTFDNFKIYHTALIHKLKSAKYNLDRLSETLGNPNIQDAIDPNSNFMFEVNMLIDGYFYNSGSALDILSRVVLTLYNEPLTGRIYFHTAHNRLSHTRPGDSILTKISTPNWKNEFSDYRNVLTHELVIASRYNIEIDSTGNSQTIKIVFPLPDNPRSTPANREFKKNPDVESYIKNQFRRTLSLLNQTYTELYNRAKTVGHFPL